jgi:LysR family transcriptional regulator of abg operon
MKLHHLRDVVAIVERGSLRGAARHLGLAQPAISRSIRDLEQELGVELFERSKSGMTLTPIGQIFLRRAKGMQAELQRTLEEIDQFKGKDLGTVSVGLSTAAHFALLPRVVTPFRKRYPNIRLNVTEGLFPRVEADIRDGLMDIYYGPVPKNFYDAGLVVDLLFDNRRIIIGRSGHPLAGATSIRDLVGAEWVTTPVMVNSENEVNTLFKSAGLPAPHIAAQASSGLSIVTLVASSDLLAPMPQQWLDIIGRIQIVQQIPVRELPDAPRISVVRRAGLPLTPAASYFNDLVRRAAFIHAQKMGLLEPAKDGLDH